jgi:hypothetical protein
VEAAKGPGSAMKMYSSQKCWLPEKKKTRKVLIQRGMLVLSRKRERATI